jgi:hypothetical protein
MPILLMNDHVFSLPKCLKSITEAHLGRAAVTNMTASESAAQRRDRESEMVDLQSFARYGEPLLS